MSILVDKSIILIFEDMHGHRVFFKEATIFDVVNAAKQYVDDEIASGTFIEPAKFMKRKISDSDEK
jgi:hypothetical protein